MCKPLNHDQEHHALIIQQLGDEKAEHTTEPCGSTHYLDRPMRELCDVVGNENAATWRANGEETMCLYS